MIPVLSKCHTPNFQGAKTEHDIWQASQISVEHVCRAQFQRKERMGCKSQSRQGKVLTRTNKLSAVSGIQCEGNYDRCQQSSNLCCYNIKMV